MEKTLKIKPSLIRALKKSASEAVRHSLKLKQPKKLISEKPKSIYNNSLISLSKSTSKKKIPSHELRLNIKSVKKFSVPRKRNHSVEGNYDEQKPNSRLNKRNSSLIEFKPIELDWNTSKLPLSPAVVLRNFSRELTYFEQSEILAYKNIYYIAPGIGKLENNSKQPNYGFDDERNDYILIKNDHILYRFEIIDILGRGSYGQVIKAFDHKTKKLVALKIIRNLSCILHQAKIEIQILYKLVQSAEINKYIIHILEHFIFRNHICLCFELLDQNLYQYIHSKQPPSLPLNMVKIFSKQILEAIQFFHNLNIIHCDLKPENIMLGEDKESVKVIDFGSGCFNTKKIFTYIQSRFYRAPEVILEISYDEKIDIWSLGCIIVEMCIGKPVFAGREEVEQFFCIMEVLGMPPTWMLEKSEKKHLITENLKKIGSSPNSKFRTPSSRPLRNLITFGDPLFFDFLLSKFYLELLAWEPHNRLTATSALEHDWFHKTSVLQHTSSLPVIKPEKIVTPRIAGKKHMKKLV